jgi:hypothetical protein
MVERLEDEMRSTVDAVADVETVEQAMRIVIAVESSEINEIFMNVVKACPAEFVRVIGRFWNAEQHHMEFICRRIPELVPELADECAELK